MVMKYKIYGVAKSENSNCRVNMYEDTDEDEDTNGIQSVTIETHGDVPDLAFVEIIAIDEQKGRDLYDKIVESWLFDIQRAIWFENA